MKREELMQIIQDCSVEGRVGAVNKFCDDLDKKKEIIANQLQEIENYLDSEVHPRCEYDIYSNLKDMIQSVESKYDN